ncbi:DUF1045 domain-containing protein [Sulfitobacter sp. PR48]|uniref:DUF1045 domain-containing protein n=1 Tax=Sulfitobacter sp. PR48 TaxID=3028383 RepID=UPI00237A19AD|nr:DUF1045 domain-containing protein [Sulfitobacter sp. PR48]MDD9720424.1 DUF1045 domain-containing protein [Sulfitobacter sp. PR48]
MFKRFAVYFTPQGALADKGAAWLGWDIASGCAADHPNIAGLDLAGLTATPRKYGFHATIKPPFALATGTDVAGLSQALARFCTQFAPVTLDGLQVAQLGGFLALIPTGDQEQLNHLAGEAVMRLDRFRAPPTAEELTRRRASHLTPQQERNLREWGYPHVLDAFRFHMTLSGRVKQPKQILPAVAAHFADVLPQPFLIDSLTLAGERHDGMFEALQRYALAG